MTEIFNPLVSIIIPVYNGSKFMKDAIDSALAQTYKNIEVIVVNDGSTDNGSTRDTALSYGTKIKYFEKENGGVATALNFGIKEMKGDFFSWLSHDDIYYPFKIKQQIDLLKLFNRKSIVLYSDFEYIDQNGVFIREAKKNKSCFFKINSYESVLLGRLNGITMLIPKKMIIQAGLFDNTLVTTQDYDLWFKLAALTEFVHIPEILAKSRIHTEQGTLSNPKHLIECNELYKIFVNWFFTKGNEIRLGLFFNIRLLIHMISCGYKESAQYFVKHPNNNKMESAILKFLYLVFNR